MLFYWVPRPRIPITGPLAWVLRNAYQQACTYFSSAEYSVLCCTAHSSGSQLPRAASHRATFLSYPQHLTGPPPLPPTLHFLYPWSVSLRRGPGGYLPSSHIMAGKKGHCRCYRRPAPSPSPAGISRPLAAHPASPAGAAGLDAGAAGAGSRWAGRVMRLQRGPRGAQYCSHPADDESLAAAGRCTRPAGCRAGATRRGR